jgi:hypothetical protein
MSSKAAKAAAGLLAAVLAAPLALSPAGQKPAGAAIPEAKAGPPADLLAELNNTSRAAYRSARADALRRCGPVLLVEGDRLVLRYGIHRTEAAVVPARYHTLKAVSHVPLALYSLLAPAADGELDATRLYDLRRYQGQVKAAQAGLDGRGLEAAQLQRQNDLLDGCLDFLAGALERRRVGRKELTDFTRRLRPLLDANARDAARLQIAATHEQVRAWRATLSDDEWKRLTVIVLGSQLPRKDNLAVQYFARLLGESGEGRRIVYAEGLGDEQRALDLLGTHLVDTGLGAAFFDDPARMHRDLLGDAAKEALDELFRDPKP